MAVSLNFAGVSELEQHHQSLIKDRVDEFLQRNNIKQGHVHLDIKPRFKTRKGEPEFKTNARLYHSDGEIIAQVRVYGAVRSVMEALERIETQYKERKKRK